MRKDTVTEASVAEVTIMVMMTAEGRTNEQSLPADSGRRRKVKAVSVLWSTQLAVLGLAWVKELSNQVEIYSIHHRCRRRRHVLRWMT